jgi:hypothetical protein
MFVCFWGRQVPLPGPRSAVERLYVVLLNFSSLVPSVALPRTHVASQISPDHEATELLLEQSLQSLIDTRTCQIMHRVLLDRIHYSHQRAADTAELQTSTTCEPYVWSLSLQDNQLAHLNSDH